MRTILFPTDFSEQAENAFTYALHLALRIEADLHVLHSYIHPPPVSIHPEMVGEMYSGLEQSQLEWYESKIPHLEEKAADEGLPAERLKFLFEEGPLPALVKQITKTTKVHLIVMGTHGQSGFLDRIIGSNTISVINSVKTPLIAVPPHARFNGIHKVAFTTLFRENDKIPLREALIMAREVGAQTDCIHVSTQPDNSMLTTHTELWTKEFERYDVQVKILDQIESVEQTITHYILDQNIDMLAVIKRNRSFLDRLFKTSTTNNLTFHTKVPIIVYHEE